MGCPLPPYIKEWRRGGPALSLWRVLGSPTPTGSRIPPFLVQLGVLPSSRSRRQGRGRGKGRKEGVRPLPLVQFGLGLGGRATCPRQPLSLSRMAQLGPILLPANSSNSLVLREIP